jgi:hypothetical protein
MQEMKLLMLVAAIAAAMLLVLAMSAMLGVPPQDRIEADGSASQQGSP